MSVTEEDESHPYDAGDAGSSDEDDREGISAPPAGNTEGDSIPLSKEQVREARGVYNVVISGTIPVWGWEWEGG